MKERILKFVLTYTLSLMFDLLWSQSDEVLNKLSVILLSLKYVYYILS